MKNLKSFEQLNEAAGTSPQGLVLLEKLEKTIIDNARDYWQKRGARFGEKQRVKDFDKDFLVGCRSIPFALEDNEFITHDVRIVTGGFSGKKICCALRVLPILKNGQPGKPITIQEEYLFDE
jgi:hypothetical protein